MPSRGQLFVVDGDLTKLACDAILVPTDNDLSITRLWSRLLDMPSAGRLDGVDFPRNSRIAPYRSAQAGDGPEIWLGDFGRSGEPAEWYADGLEEFVREVGPRLRRRGHGAPPKVAVNLAGSGAGGARGRKGDLVSVIVPRLHRVARSANVDVVLVCFGEKQFAAAQRARQEIDLDPLPEHLVEHADRLAAATLRRNLVLFLGAGVSMGAGVASWSQLLDRLRLTTGTDEKPVPEPEAFERLDLLDRAALVERRLGNRRSFDKVLAAELGKGTRYSLSHGLLAGLRTRENVTTNYDTLFEEALRTAKRRCAVLPYEAVEGDEPWLLKLHGSVHASDDFVLTRGDYLGLRETSGALFGVLQAMLMTRHMLFVGYSLEDDSFHQVMHEVRQALKGRTTEVGTVLMLYRDDLLAELWKDMLHLVPIIDEPWPTKVKDHHVRRAARELDVFLDRVAFQAADVSSFLLDRTYASMLDPEEKELRRMVRELLRRASADRDDSAIATQIELLLGPLQR